MSDFLHPLGAAEAVPTRPGMHARTVIGAEHGVTSLFVSEMIMDHGSFIPLHSHPVEEAFVVREGELTVQIGDETLRAAADTVVWVPANVPHALRNDAAAPARALGAGAWNRATWFTAGTTYLEGSPREP